MKSLPTAAALLAAGVVLVGCGTSSSVNKTAKPRTSVDASGATILAAAPPGADAIAQRWMRVSMTRSDLKTSWDLLASSWQAKYTRSEWLAGQIPIAPLDHRIRIDRFKVDTVFQRKGDPRLGIRYTIIGHAGKSGTAGFQHFKSDWFIYLVRQRGTWRVAYYTPFAPPPPARV